jgi:hypothetical protein
MNVWDTQLTYDAKTSITAVVMDGAIEILVNENLINDNDYAEIMKIVEAKVNDVSNVIIENHRIYL